MEEVECPNTDAIGGHIDLGTSYLFGLCDSRDCGRAQLAIYGKHSYMSILIFNNIR